MSYAQSSVNWKKRPPASGLSNSKPILTIFRLKFWERSKTACSRRGSRRILYADPNEKKPAGHDAFGAMQPQAFEKVQEIIFAETSTFGIRYREMNRKTLDREWVEVKTSAGQIQVKIGRQAGKILQVAPEFESCHAAAQRAACL